MMSRKEALSADWHPEIIKAEVHKRGLSFRALSIQAGYSRDSLKTVLRTPCKPYQQIVADALGVEESLSAAHLRLSMATIEHLDWAECIKRYDRPDTLFYLDPPYCGTADYGVEFGLDEYTKMASLARIIQGSMVISVNDIPEMRTIFDGFRKPD